MSVTNNYIASGFKAEIAELIVAGAPWWTLACEIVGDLSKPMEKLQLGMSWLLEDTEYQGPELKLEDSYSYPQLIAILLDALQRDIDFAR